MKTLLAALLIALLTGCATIPTSGPVERVEDESGLGESTVRYMPAGPAKDATETTGGPPRGLIAWVDTAS